MADRVAEGWTYLKLDFLYAGAQEGPRAQDVTGIEAYHVGMGLLREAAGDAWLLACGATFVPEDPLSQLSGLDASLVVEAVNPDDQVPMTWTYSEGTTVFTTLLNLSESVREVYSPGGRELLSGAEAESGRVILQPGSGQLWQWSVLASSLASSAD